MNKKTYNEGKISFSFHGGRNWRFDIPATETADKLSYTLFHDALGGVRTATRIAKQIAGAVKRCGKIDGTARFHIHNIATAARQAHE